MQPYAATRRAARYTRRMLVLPLDVALTVLVVASLMMSVQLVILAVEISAVRREVRVLVHLARQIDRAVNPWAGEETPSERVQKKKRPQPE